MPKGQFYLARQSCLDTGCFQWRGKERERGCPSQGEPGQKSDLAVLHHPPGGHCLTLLAIWGAKKADLMKVKFEFPVIHLQKTASSVSCNMVIVLPYRLVLICTCILKAAGQYIVTQMHFRHHPMQKKIQQWSM